MLHIQIDIRTGQQGIVVNRITFGIKMISDIFVNISQSRFKTRFGGIGVIGCKKIFRFFRQEVIARGQRAGKQ